MPYLEWGFTQNPFSTRPLEESDRGKKLLVGRIREMKTILGRLQDPESWVTVEGDNGIGKTSLINVAKHIAFTEALADSSKPLLIPCATDFQLDMTDTPQRFAQKAFFDIAQTLVIRERDIEETGRKLPDVSAINRWLNSPELSGVQANIGFLGGGVTPVPNYGEGFAESGLRRQVEGWLTSAFPGGRGGGIVCVIDNLELLQTSKKAKEMIESLRDLLLNVRGLRWILCGAAGIVRSVASSTRLQGYLSAPVEIGSIEGESSSRILQSRVGAYARDSGNVYLPFESSNFEVLYDILHQNLRATLGYANDYCQWVVDNARKPLKPEEKDVVFQEWLGHECRKHFSVAKLAPRAWQVFDLATRKGGQFSPSDFDDFEFNNPQAFRPQVADLEDFELVNSIVDDSDKRRRMIYITPKGWMVAHYRKTEGLSVSDK